MSDFRATVTGFIGTGKMAPQPRTKDDKKALFFKMYVRRDWEKPDPETGYKPSNLITVFVPERLRWLYEKLEGGQRVQVTGNYHDKENTFTPADGSKPMDHSDRVIQAWEIIPIATLAKTVTGEPETTTVEEPPQGASEEDPL